MPYDECDKSGKGNPATKTTGETQVEGQKKSSQPLFWRLTRCVHKPQLESQCTRQALYGTDHCAEHIVIERDEPPDRRRWREWLAELKARGGAIGQGDARPNFVEAVFSDEGVTDLRAMEFRRCDMQRTSFMHVHLDGSTFYKCDLTRSTFKSCGLVKVHVSDCVLYRMTFELCDLAKSTIEHSEFKESTIRGSRDIDTFRSARIEDVDIVQCDISGIDFTSARVISMRFRGPCGFENTRMTRRQMLRCVHFDAEAQKTMDQITRVDPTWYKLFVSIRTLLTTDLHALIVRSSPLLLLKWVLATFLMAGILTLLGLSAVQAVGIANVTTGSFFAITGILGLVIMALSAAGYRSDSQRFVRGHPPS